MTTNTYTGNHRPGAICSFFPLRQSLSGLFIHVRVRNSGCVTLVDLEQVDRFLQEENRALPNWILSATEQDYFKRFSYPKRRREWLGGRIAVKMAMLSTDYSTSSDWLTTAMRRITILPDTHGRPVVEEKDNLLSPSAISISHSKRFAVGFAVGADNCGVDIQEISKKLSGLVDRFASSRELDLLAGQLINGEEATGLTMLWTAKEALKKSLLYDQPVVFTGIDVQDIEMIRGNKYRFACTVKGHAEQSVIVYNFFPYILSLTMDCHA